MALKYSMWLAYHPFNASSIDRTLRKEGTLRRRRNKHDSKSGGGGGGDGDGEVRETEWCSLVAR